MRMRAWPLALAAGAWALAWWVVPVVLHLSLPQEVRTDAVAGVLLFGHAFARWSGIPTPLAHLVQPLAVFTAAAVATAFARWLFLRLDREGDARAALLWSCRTLPAGAVWTLAGWALMAAAAHADGAASVGWLMLVPVAVWSLLLPFIALRPDVISADDPPRLWMPVWPGLGAVLIGTACAAVQLSLSALEASTAHAAPSLPLVAWLATWIPSAFVTALTLQAWQSRSHLNDFAVLARRAWRPATLRRVMATDVAIGSASIIVVGLPILIAAILVIWILPQTEAIAQDAGVRIPAALALYMRIGRVVVDGWWWVAAPPFAWLSLVVPARALWRMEQAREPAAPGRSAEAVTRS